MSYWKNKVVVITGAGSGIGRALAHEWAKKGARLAICDKNLETLTTLVKALEQYTVVPYVQAVDVAQELEMQLFAERVYAHYGQVDAMVNNAGVAQTSTNVSELSTEDFKWLMAINFWGMVYGSKAFLPYLRKQPESHLANVSSIFGMVAVPGLSSYNASKFAIRGFTEALVLEERLAKTGVAVASIHPGGVKTNILRSARGIEQTTEDVDAMEALLRLTPERAAKSIIKGIRQKKDRILVGGDAFLMNWANKWLRKVVQWETLRTVKRTNS